MTISFGREPPFALLSQSLDLTNSSAPSMHTNRARFLGLALLTTSAINTPVNRAVESPAAPQENPLLLRT